MHESLSIADSFIAGVLAQQTSTEVSPAGDVRLLKKELNLLSYAFLFVNRALQYNHQLLGTLYGFPTLSNVLRVALIDVDGDEIQRLTANTIKELCLKLDTDDTLTLKPSFFFMRMFLSECLLYGLRVAKGERTRIFFDLLNEVFTRTEVHRSL